MKLIAAFLILGMAHLLSADDELYQHQHSQPAEQSQELHDHTMHNMDHSYSTIVDGSWRFKNERATTCLKKIFLATQV
jgi:hypothetical protein